MHKGDKRHAGKGPFPFCERVMIITLSFDATSLECNTSREEYM